MLIEALEAEVADYIERHEHETDETGRRRVVQNGKARPRKVTLGRVTVEVGAARVDDRCTDEDGKPKRFASNLLPPYMRHSPKVGEVLPAHYAEGSARETSRKRFRRFRARRRPRA